MFISLLLPLQYNKKICEKYLSAGLILVRKTVPFFWGGGGLAEPTCSSKWSNVSVVNDKKTQSFESYDSQFREAGRAKEIKRDSRKCRMSRKSFYLPFWVRVP